MSDKFEPTTEFMDLSSLHGYAVRTKSNAMFQDKGGRVPLHMMPDFIELALSRAIANDEHLRKRIEELEQRLDEAENGTSFKGVWQSSVTYRKGSFVTWGGSMWHANFLSTGQKPGESKSWTLAVKKGRDGKELPK